MYRRISAVAINTFRETVRDRIFYLVGFFGAGLILAGVVLSPLTIGAQKKIVADVGLGSMALFGLLVVVLVGSSMLRKEIEKRTVTTILSKPVTRREYLLGKFLGLNMTLVCMLVAMAVLFIGVVLLSADGMHTGYFAAFYLTFVELLVINAAVVFFSTFASPALAAIFTICFFVVGHLSESIMRFGSVMGGDSHALASKIVYYVVPNLEIFNVRAQVVHGDPIASSHVLLATLYGVGITGIFIVLAGSVFARRELR